MAMGGRVAEELIFGADKVSNGASGDIKMATDLARRWSPNGACPRSSA